MVLRAVNRQIYFLTAGTQPCYDFLGFIVNGERIGDLRCFLQRVVLVNADLINPQPSLAATVAVVWPFRVRLDMLLRAAFPTLLRANFRMFSKGDPRIPFPELTQELCQTFGHGKLCSVDHSPLREDRHASRIRECLVPHVSLFIVQGRCVEDGEVDLRKCASEWFIA